MLELLNHAKSLLVNDVSVQGHLKPIAALAKPHEATVEHRPSLLITCDDLTIGSRVLDTRDDRVVDWA